MPGLFVVRHCEPSITGVLLGQCDPPLSEAGRTHARSLQLPKLAIVYSSPLRRAFETARAIARGAPIETVDDFREISYGTWDGRAWAEIEATDPQAADSKLANWHDVTPPGGESWENFAGRVTRALAQIRSGPRPAAIVAHAAVNQVIAQIDQEYGGIHEL